MEKLLDKTIDDSSTGPVKILRCYSHNADKVLIEEYDVSDDGEKLASTKKIPSDNAIKYVQSVIDSVKKKHVT